MNSSSKITIVVPQQTTNDEDPTSVRSFVEHRLSELFGGSTSVDAYGNWVDDKGILVEEPVWNVYSYATDRVNDDQAKEIRNIAEIVRDSLDQDCVLVTIEPVISIEFV